ncbi:hypothetical protein R1sor_019789 [Riccia sorocarpa]|uniref:Myb/SANT-like DNA-binding domain-containing protein n=1 Tax=Riccia sorocarpa TaxID=122646 RepID=A0ABD3IG81_9MARC
MDARASSSMGNGGGMASPESDLEWLNPGQAFEPHFDLNEGSVPSSQRAVPFEFGRIPTDDNFDTTRVHPAARSGFAAVQESGASIRTQARSRQPPTGNITKIHRRQWESWQVEALLECKKLESEELENLVGREQILSSDMKWKCIHTAMLERGVQADPSQLKNKWESVLGSYKKVKDWNLGLIKTSRKDRPRGSTP